jgi:Zn-dependent protease
MRVNVEHRNIYSLHLGRWLGIDVYLHLTFLLLLAFIGVAHGLAGRSVEAALGGVLFFAGLFTCVLLHEYGRALAARRYGVGTRDITLLPIGGVARLERMPDNVEKGLAMPVIESGHVIGLVTAENVGEFFMIRALLANRPPPAIPPPLPPRMAMTPLMRAPSGTTLSR